MLLTLHPSGPNHRPGMLYALKCHERTRHPMHHLQQVGATRPPSSSCPTQPRRRSPHAISFLHSHPTQLCQTQSSGYRSLLLWKSHTGLLEFPPMNVSTGSGSPKKALPSSCLRTRAIPTQRSPAFAFRKPYHWLGLIPPWAPPKPETNEGDMCDGATAHSSCTSH